MQYVWGIRYVDDCVFHRADGNNDGDYQDSGEGRWFHLTDVQFSTVAILDHQGRLVERVSYDSYGTARNHRAGDVDGDGDCDSNDKAIVDLVILNGSNSIGQANYRAELDLNRDGLVNSTDSTMANQTAAALAHGTLSVGPSGTSAPDNSIGWCGYVFNRGTQQYLVRFRTFDTLIGRWVERDPAGYVDGMCLYEYAASTPMSAVDPMGLASQRPGKKKLLDQKIPRPTNPGKATRYSGKDPYYRKMEQQAACGTQTRGRDKRNSADLALEAIQRQNEDALESIETGARRARQGMEVAVEAGELAIAIATPIPGDEAAVVLVFGTKIVKVVKGASKVVRKIDDLVEAAQKKYPGKAGKTEHGNATPCL